MPSTLIITLYSKPDCHLCSDLKAVLLRLRQELDFSLVERNIEEDPNDWKRFRYLIPVLEIGGAALLYPPHSLASVRQALLTARQGQES
jgi:hypothetical protein